MSSPIHNKLLLAILTLSFLLSLAYSFYHRIEPVVDARSYDQIAVNLVEGYGFREDRALSYGFDPSIIRAGPLYEFFLAGIYGLFGHQYEAVWVIQAILHALSAYLVFLIGRMLFAEQGVTIGLIAAAFIGVHPDLIEISAMLMTETLYLFLVVLLVWTFLKVFRSPRSCSVVSLLALIAALSILIRPPVALFVPVFLLYFLQHKHYRQLAWFSLLLLLFLAPWTARNYYLYKTFVPTTLIGAYNLWVGNTLLSLGGQFAGEVNPATEYLERYGAVAFKQEAGTQFRQFIIEHPGVFVKLSAVRVIRYFSLLRPMGFWFYQEGLPQFIFVALSGISIAALFLSGFAGLWQLLKEKKELWQYLAALALSAPLPLIFTVVQSRYRFQIYPFLAIFGAYGIVRLWQRSPEAFKAALATLSVFAVVSAIDALAFWPVIVERLGVLF